MIFAKKPIFFLNFLFLLTICIASIKCQNDAPPGPNPGVGIPASDVGTPDMNVGTPATDVGTPAMDVGTPVTQALPPTYTDAEMTYHVAGKTSMVNGSDITITSPTSATTWVANETNTVTWTGSTPARLSIQLIVDNTTVRSSGLSLRASVATSDGSATCDIPNLPEGNGYFIRFYDQLDISKTLATSDKFTIRKQTSEPIQVSGGVDLSPAANGQPNSTSGNTTTTTTTGTLPGKNGSYKRYSIELPLASAILVLAFSCFWM